MPTQQSDEDFATGLSGRERGAIERFLVYIEDRVKDAEPACADLVRRARLALKSPSSLTDPDCVLH